MKGPVRIQVATHMIGVESNKKNIPQLSRHQLQACIGRRPGYRFPHDEHVVFHKYIGLTQWSFIVVIDLVEIAQDALCL